MARKPDWVVEKERARREGPPPVWLFGLHAEGAAHHGLIGRVHVGACLHLEQEKTQAEDCADDELCEGAALNEDHDTDEEDAA